jgi:hypothetical protein
MMAKTMIHKPPADMTDQPTNRQDVLAVTTACTKDALPALAVLRAAFNKPYLHPSEDPSGNGFTPQHSAFRELARVISGVADCYDLSGRPYLAAQIALDGEEMAVTIPHGGGQLPRMVGSACQSISMHAFERLLPKLNSSELDAIGARLERISATRTPYRETLLTAADENALSKLEYLRTLGKKSLFGRYRAISDDLDSADNTVGMINSLVGKQNHPTTKSKPMQIARFMFSNKGAAIRQKLDYNRALARESEQPFTGKSSIQAPKDQSLYPLAVNANDFRSDAVTTEVELDLYRIETALYRYKAHRGKFPSQLIDLKPTYLREVPVDGFGGGAFRYSVTVSGFLLYSIGSDFTDDGGTPKQWPASLTPGDIVAGQIYPKREWEN